jgi:serine/threonine protein kinase
MKPWANLWRLFSRQGSRSLRSALQEPGPDAFVAKPAQWHSPQKTPPSPAKFATGRPQEISFDAYFVRERIRANLFGLPRPTIRIEQFVVLEKIGQGGAGAVYAGYDEKLDRSVALKFLNSQANLNEVNRIRLVREAQAMARLSHPNVIQVYSLHEDGGEYFLAMEFIAGQTMGAWLAEKERGWLEIVNAFLEAGKGLAAAHEVGLVHRDFKPSNVMLQANGRVCVGDFGCASGKSEAFAEYESEITLEDEVAASSLLSASSWSGLLQVPLTRDGGVLGTTAYMAPEQLARRHVDQRSDLYSFCVALYEGLYGHRPTSDVDLVVKGQHISKRRWLGGIPRKVREVIKRGLAEAPEDRFSSMSELLHHLRRASQARHRLKLRAAIACIFLAIGGLLAAPLLASECEPFLESATSLWDDAMREEVHAAFLRANFAQSDEAWEKTSNAVQRYLDQWTRVASNVCETTLNVSAEERRSRKSKFNCLEQRRRELAQVLHVLAAGDRAKLQNAVTALVNLPAPQRCENRAGRLAPVAQDDYDSEPAMAVRLDLARARAMESAGEFAASRELGQAALRRAQEVLSPILQAEALYQIGRVEESLARAEETLLNAQDLADSNGYDDLAGDVGLRLLWVANNRAQPWSAKLHFHRLKSTLARLDDQGERWAAGLNALGYAKELSGELESAIQDIEEGLAIRWRQMPVQRLAVSESLRYHAYALELWGEAQEAISSLQRALEIEEDELGSFHPNVARSRHALALMLSDAGQWDQAEVNFDRAAAIYGDDAQTNAFALAQIELGRGELALYRGDFEGAKRYCLGSSARFDQILKPSDSSWADFFRLFGRIELANDEPEAALANFTQANEILRLTLSESSFEVARNLASCGDALLRSGKYESALSHFRRALIGLEPALGPFHSERIRTYVGEAIALLAIEQPDAACAAIRPRLAAFAQHSQGTDREFEQRLATLAIACR